MLKLHQLFFRKMFILLATVFLIGAVFGYVLLRNMAIDTHEVMLKNMLNAFDLEKLKKERIIPVRIFDRVHRETGARVTLIDRDGKVLYESERDPAGMENHAERPEIKEARKEGWGRAVRHSGTIDSDLLYVARRYGSLTLRLSYSLSAINRELFHLWIKSMIFFGVMLLFAYLLNRKWHKKIEKDVETIGESLQRLLKKDFENEYGLIECCRELDEIERLIQRVSRKLHKRERQKEKYTKKLKMLTRRQSDIISAISHELKNPVAAIMGYSQTLMEEKGLDEKQKKRFLSKIFFNAEKISYMIDRLSLAIKLENRSFIAKKSEFSLPEVAEEVCEVMRQRFPGRKIRIKCEDILLYADRDMIENVLVNLLENALKYSSGKVLLACSGKLLEVIDEGVGISAEEIEKITKRFYRVDGLTWNNSIGVGLYIVKYILRLHDTDLEIESVPSNGSRFFFSLDKMTARAS